MAQPHQPFEHEIDEACPQHRVDPVLRRLVGRGHREHHHRGDADRHRGIGRLGHVAAGRLGDELSQCRENEPLGHRMRKGLTGAMKPGSRPSRSVTNVRKVPACGEAVNDGLHTARARSWGGWSGPPGRRVQAEFYPGNGEKPDKSSFFPRISKWPRGHYDSGHCSRIAKTHTFKYWLVSDGYVSSGTTRRNRRRAVRVDLRGRHHHDEDHDPVAGLRHPRQRGPDRDRDPDP